MTMFQVLTQKGWVDIMHTTMRQASRLSPLVAIYFISYHLFVTLVCLINVVFTCCLCCFCACFVF
jgi:hypothetical protein